MIKKLWESAVAILCKLTFNHDLFLICIYLQDNLIPWSVDLFERVVFQKERDEVDLQGPVILLFIKTTNIFE